jgi:hypothetical protein
MKKNPKAAPFQKKGWIHYQAIQTLLPTKPKGLNVFQSGQPTTQEENGDNDLPGGGFDNLSGSGTSEDMGRKNLHHSDEEDEEEEPIPWVSQAIGLINCSSQVCSQERAPPCKTPLQQSLAQRSPSPISRCHKRKPSNLSSLATTPAVKKQHTLTGAALEGLGDRLSEFNETFWENNKPQHGAGIESTPACKRTAICRAQELETDLAIEHVVVLIHIFEGDVSAADAYVVLKREELQKLWVRSKLGLV